MAEPCEHLRFQAKCAVNRFKDGDKFLLEVSVECSVCHLSFRFLGLPTGLQMFGAACGVDGLEARLAIVPADGSHWCLAEGTTIH